MKTRMQIRKKIQKLRVVKEYWDVGTSPYQDAELQMQILLWVLRR